MAYMEWDDSLSVGVPVFDQQHQRLVGYLNELHDAMRAGKGATVLSGILDGLAEYTETHFASEEEAFRKYGYPQTEEHVAEHRGLIEKVHNLQAEASSGKLLISVSVLGFLKDWVTNHISGSDKAYSSFLAGKSV